MVCCQGDKCNGLYVVISGRLRTFTTPAGTKKQQRNANREAQGGAGGDSDDSDRETTESSEAEDEGDEDLKDLFGDDKTAREQSRVDIGRCVDALMIDVSLCHSINVSRGETVGELSVLTEAPTREADAVCIRDCELVHITRASFQRIIQLFPKVMKRFSRLLAKRHQEVCSVVCFGAFVLLSLLRCS